MKFSIITCTWNSAATLAETIASVQAQQGVEVEQIFVDGGSTDGTLALIAAQCPDARVLRDVKGGISRAMNVGIAAASGDVVAHLHSDDYYAAPDVLAAVEQAFRGDAMWAYGRIDVLADGQLIHPQGPAPRFSAFAYASGSASVPHPATFVRRQVFDELGGFDESLKLAMDIDMWLRIGSRYRPAQLERVLTVFREHPGSVSSANKLKAREEERQVRRRYLWQQPLAHLIYELRYLKRMRELRAEA